MINYLTIQKEVPVEITLRVTQEELYFLDNPDNKTIHLSLSIKEGICQAYTKDIDGTGTTYICSSSPQYPFRELPSGIQFYDGGMWRYFPEITQRMWIDYKAEEAILGEYYGDNT